MEVYASLRLKVVEASWDCPICEYGNHFHEESLFPYECIQCGFEIRELYREESTEQLIELDDEVVDTYREEYEKSLEEEEEDEE